MIVGQKRIARLKVAGCFGNEEAVNVAVVLQLDENVALLVSVNTHAAGLNERTSALPRLAADHLLILYVNKHWNPGRLRSCGRDRRRYRDP